MTFGAIAAAIGLIIDDAMVVVEQIHRTHEEYPERPSTQLVHQAIKLSFSIYGWIVIKYHCHLLYLFLLLSGVAGAYFNVLTNTMIITLVCSFLVTWIGLTCHIYLAFRTETFVPGEEGAEDIKTVTKSKRHGLAWFINRSGNQYRFSYSFLLASIIYILPKT